MLVLLPLLQPLLRQRCRVHPAGASAAARGRASAWQKTAQGRALAQLLQRQRQLLLLSLLLPPPLQ